MIEGDGTCDVVLIAIWTVESVSGLKVQPFIMSPSVTTSVYHITYNGTKLGFAIYASCDRPLTNQPPCF